MINIDAPPVRDETAAATLALHHLALAATYYESSADAPIAYALTHDTGSDPYIVARNAFINTLRRWYTTHDQDQDPGSAA